MGLIVRPDGSPAGLADPVLWDKIREAPAPADPAPWRARPIRS